jgi:hypothetical protein
MWSGIRTKLAATLLVAVTVPVALGLATIHFVGERNHCAQRGDDLHARAVYAASRVDDAISDQIANLRQWVSLSDLGARVHAMEVDQPPRSPGLFRAEVEQMEARWAALGHDDPELRRFLDNDVARAIRSYEAVHPLAAEIFVTDSRGRLIAASGKTSDYWQADEGWWKKAFRMGPNRVRVEGIHYDESAEVHSLDVALPIVRERGVDDTVVGVVKCVLNASPLLSSLREAPAQESAAIDVITEDGRVLARLFEDPSMPARERVDASAWDGLRKAEQGWLVTRLDGIHPALAGVALLRVSGKPVGAAIVSGVNPMYVVAHRDLAAVLEPVRRQMGILLLLGAVVVLAFVSAGILLASNFILKPLDLLRAAAGGLAQPAGAAGATGVADEASGPAGIESTARTAVQRVENIRTGDEIETLAREFSAMADRVMNQKDPRPRSHEES